MNPSWEMRPGGSGLAGSHPWARGPTDRQTGARTPARPPGPRAGSFDRPAERTFRCGPYPKAPSTKASSSGRRLKPVSRASSAPSRNNTSVGVAMTP